MLLLCAAVILYLLTAGWNLGGQTIANPDEPRFAVAARTMLRSGDWIVPQFNGKERTKKPILFYWVIAAAGRAGEALGLRLDTGMRAGPVFMGLLAVIATFLIAARLMRTPQAGFVAAVVLMTCNEFHKVSREIVIDMTLTAFLTWSWYFVLVALGRIAQNASRFLPLLGFYICLGLACMTKGPLPVAGFVVLPLVVYLFLTQQPKALARAGIWWGAPLSLALGFWWFYVLNKTGHGEGVSEFFVVENFKRIMGEKDHIHRWPWAYYFTVLWEGFAPWILALPFLLWWTWKNLNDGIRNATEPVKFVFSALGAAFLIVGLSQSKRMLYLLPLFPPFAVWVAWLWQTAIAPFATRKNISWAALGMALAGALIYEIFVTRAREEADWRPQFFKDVEDQLRGRRLVTTGESANEAIWYLDRTDPILNLTNPALESEFFNSPGTVLLLKEVDSGKKSKQKDPKRSEFEQKLREALVIEYEHRRADGMYYLATPKPGYPPDRDIFKPRHAETRQDTDSGDE